MLLAVLALCLTAAVAKEVATAKDERVRWSQRRASPCMARDEGAALLHWTTSLSTPCWPTFTA
jgi:hypothetical protein